MKQPSTLKRMSDKKLIGIVVRLGIVGTLFLVTLITQFYTFAWFSNNSGISSDHFTGNSSGAAMVTVYKSESDFLAGTEMSENDRLTISPPAESMITPGSSGSFQVWVSFENPSDSYELRMSCRTDEYIEGVATAIVDSENPADGKFAEYVRTHIAFFLTRTSVENTYRYDDWINPDADGGMVIAQTDIQPLTVYWVWIESYNQLNNNTIFLDDSIRTHFTNNPLKWLKSTDDPLVKAYDDADWAIGMGLNQTKICFTLDFWLAGANRSGS